MKSVLIGLSCAMAFAAVIARGETDVYLLIGQSNMAGRGALAPDESISCEGVRKMDVYGYLVPAKEPLHYDKKSAGAGLGSSFANALRAADTNRTIVLVPCAFGGSKLDEWAKGEYMYEQAILRTRQALRKLTGEGRLSGILWHQGEADAYDRKLAESYGARLAKTMGDLRADLGCGEVPIVVGELGRYLAENRAKSGRYPHFETINAALNDLTNVVRNCACVSSEGLTPNKDILHFNTPSLRIFGERYAAALKGLQSRALSASVTFPTVKQTVETEWPDAASAATATAEVTLLGKDERFVFSGRWDDRNPRSLALAKALSPLGFHSTFYTNGKSDPKYTRILRELVALGNSIGCHTLSHAFMSRLLPTRSFREILENRIELEIDSQSPVVTLGMPYSQAKAGSPVIGFDNVKVVGTAASNAGLLGGAQGPVGATAAFGLSDDDWVGTYVFSANDRNPDEKAFWERFAVGTNLVARGELPGGPNVNLGVHPWQSDEGLIKLAALTKAAMATPGAVMRHENDYVAARLQSRRATVRKTETRGRKAVFEIVRPHPAVLGAAVPLNLKLSDGRILEVAPPELAMPPTVFERIDGALAVSADETTFTLDFTNTTGRALADVSCALRLPPGYAPGVVRKSIPSLGAGEGVRLVFTSAAPTDPLFREGTLFAAVEINVPGRRIWAPIVKTRETHAKGPRDAACLRGLVPDAEVPSEAALAALSDPNAKLGDEWHPADGSAEGDAPWAITGFRKEDRKQACDLPWALPPLGTGFSDIFVFDFEADTTTHGAEWNCFYDGGQLVKDRINAWLNGAAFGFPSGKMTLRNGRNRLVVRLSGLNYKMLFTMIAIRSVQDGAAVRWVKNF